MQMPQQPAAPSYLIPAVSPSIAKPRQPSAPSSLLPAPGNPVASRPFSYPSFLSLNRKALASINGKALRQGPNRKASRNLNCKCPSSPQPPPPSSLPSFPQSQSPGNPAPPPHSYQPLATQRLLLHPPIPASFSLNRKALASINGKALRQGPSAPRGVFRIYVSNNNFDCTRL